jgi:hypothetical protein
MAYNLGTPVANQTLNDTHAIIRGNFNQLDTQFSVNHTSLTAANNNGKHTFVTLIQQGVHPAGDPATVADEVAVYAKELTYGVLPAPYPITEEVLYCRKENNGTVIQLTSQDPTIADPGSSFLAGGIIMKWGFVVAGPAGTAINFASRFPTNCWEVILTPQGTTGRATAVNNKSVTGFTAYATNACTCGYIAIGN